MMQYYTIRRAGLSSRPVVFLHGSGGDETSLVEFADRIAPDRPAIFLRGGMPWEDGFAFFRRHSDRSLDLGDLEQRAVEIGVLFSALRKGGTLPRRPIVIGFSNGAIMAETLLRRFSKQVAGAVLMRALSPALASDAPDLTGKPVLITAGSRDDRRQSEDAARSALTLGKLGAQTDLKIYPTAHEWIDAEAEDISTWLQKNFPD